MDPAALLTVWEEGVSQPLVTRALALLAAACPERSRDQWARASIGQRDVRLMQLQDELFGSRLETVVTCPRCGERLDVEFSTHDIGVESAPACPDEGSRMEVQGYRVHYRLPTSLDLLPEVGGSAPPERETLLLKCIATAQRADGTTVEPDTLPEAVVTAVLEDMARTDPMADVQVGLSCTDCGHEWSAPFDIVAYLWTEVDEWAQRMLLEIHSLASAYGWNEREILRLSARRRRLYLDLVGA
jgi:hypothetical protein